MKAWLDLFCPAFKGPCDTDRWGLCQIRGASKCHPWVIRTRLGLKDRSRIQRKIKRGDHIGWCRRLLNGVRMIIYGTKPPCGEDGIIRQDPDRPLSPPAVGILVAVCADLVQSSLAGEEAIQNADGGNIKLNVPAFVCRGSVLRHAKHHWQIPLRAEKSPRCDRTAMIRGFSRPMLNSYTAIS